MERLFSGLWPFSLFSPPFPIFPLFSLVSLPLALYFFGPSSFSLLPFFPLPPFFPFFLSTPLFSFPFFFLSLVFPSPFPCVSSPFSPCFPLSLFSPLFPLGSFPFPPFLFSLYFPFFLSSPFPPFLFLPLVLLLPLLPLYFCFSPYSPSLSPCFFPPFPLFSLPFPFTVLLCIPPSLFSPLSLPFIPRRSPRLPLPAPIPSRSLIHVFCRCQVKEFDSISRLDQWLTTMLLRIKKTIQGEGDGDLK